MPHAPPITIGQALDSVSELAHEFAEPSIKPITEGLEDSEREFLVAHVETLFNRATPTLPRSLNAIHDLLSGDDVDGAEKVRQATAFFKRTAKLLQKAADDIERESRALFDDVDSDSCDEEVVQAQAPAPALPPISDHIPDIVKESTYQTVHAQLMALVYIANDAQVARKEDADDDHCHDH